VKAQEDPEEQHAAQQQLAQLIRCPYLSLLWLTAALTAAEGKFLLGPLKAQTLQLLPYLQAMPASVPFSGSSYQRLFADAPQSWLSGKRRQQQRPSAASVTWRVPVSDIREKCIRAAEPDGGYQALWSRVQTPPLQGLVFGLSLGFLPKQGMVLCLDPLNIPAGVFCCLSASVKVSGSDHRFTMTREMCFKEFDIGWHNVFHLGAMAGGWDEAAWAAKGLPVDGVLKLTLKVSLG
jgi:hypothetical protein